MLMRLMSIGEYLIVPKGTKFTGSGKLGLNDNYYCWLWYLVETSIQIQINKKWNNEEQVCNQINMCSSRTLQGCITINRHKKQIFKLPNARKMNGYLKTTIIQSFVSKLIPSWKVLSFQYLTEVQLYIGKNYWKIGSRLFFFSADDVRYTIYWAAEKK